MKELEHATLFNPPEGTDVVVVPVIGHSEPKAQTFCTPMKGTYAKLALKLWPKIDLNLGISHRLIGISPHPITYPDPKKSDRITIPGKGKYPRAFKFHIVSLPTRLHYEEPLSVDYVATQLRGLVRLIGNPKTPWLNGAKVVLPQLCDKDLPWSKLKRHAEIWLSDDYTVISGREGAYT